jgi:hypothetical protein
MKAVVHPLAYISSERERQGERAKPPKGLAKGQGGKEGMIFSSFFL